MHPAESVTLLNLEFNSSCNLRCRWCALDHAKERQAMAPETLQRVMDCLADGQLPHLRRVDLHNGGETLLHPDLPGMLTVIRRAKPRLPVQPVFGLLTNAVLLTEKVALQIIRSKAVDQLRFSLDGGAPELFERIRTGAKWDVVRRNVERFLLLNEREGRPLRSEIICMIPPEGLPGGELHLQFASLFNRIDKVSLRHPHNWDGSADLGVDDASYRAIAEQRRGEVCFLLQRNLVVLPGGEVTVCCNDLNARGVIGNVLEQGLDGLAADAERLRWQELFRQGCKDEIVLCKGCTGFYAPPGGCLS